MLGDHKTEKTKKAMIFFVIQVILCQTVKSNTTGYFWRKNKI